MPRVSVILPHYRQSWGIAWAIESIRAQTYRDFELIVVDDGSDMAEVRAIRELLDLGEREHLVEIRPNGGTAAAIETGVAWAAGAYLTWVSADNRMREDWLEALVPVLDAGAGVAYGGFTWAPVTGRAQALEALVTGRAGPASRYLAPPEYRADRQIAQEECYLGPAHLIRREVWRPHTGRISHDLAHWLATEEACWEAGLPIRAVNRDLCLYVAHQERATVLRRDEYDAPAILDEARARRTRCAG